MKHITTLSLWMLLFGAKTAHAQVEERNEKKLNISTGFTLIPQAELSLKNPSEGFKTNFELQYVLSISKGNFKFAPFFNFLNRYGAELQYEFCENFGAYIVAHKSVRSTEKYIGFLIEHRLSEKWVKAFVEIGDSFSQEQESSGVVLYTGLHLSFDLLRSK